MSYSSVLRRFWWVLLIGVVAALAAGVLALRSSTDEPTYTATSQLLVTSPEVPYFRISVQRSSEEGDGSEDGVREVIQNVPPDVLTLVRAANLYPLLVMSDQVSQLRTERFGEIPGTVSARAVFAVETPSRFQPSDVPVIEVTATADTPDAAVALATATPKAFIEWLGEQQEEANVAKNQRITVQPIANPTRAVKIADTNMSLPILVAVLVLLGFVALAAMLDRMVAPRKPAQRREAGPTLEEVPLEERGPTPVVEGEVAGGSRSGRFRRLGRRPSEGVAPEEHPVDEADEVERRPDFERRSGQGSARASANRDYRA